MPSDAHARRTRSVTSSKETYTAVPYFNANSPYGIVIVVFFPGGVEAVSV